MNKEQRRQRKELKQALDAWLAGDLSDDQITAEQRKYIQKTMRERVQRTRRRFRRSVELHMFIRNITIKPIGRLRKPLPVNWHPDFWDGVNYPHCPACDELAYEKDHCVFCGRRFSQWDEQP